MSGYITNFMKQCPFCGSDKILSGRHYNTTGWVSCSNCSYTATGLIEEYFNITKSSFDKKLAKKINDGIGNPYSSRKLKKDLRHYFIKLDAESGEEIKTKKLYKLTVM